MQRPARLLPGLCNRMLKHIIIQICFLAGWTLPRLCLCFTRALSAFSTLRPRPGNVPSRVCHSRTESPSVRENGREHIKRPIGSWRKGVGTGHFQITEAEIQPSFIGTATVTVDSDPGRKPEQDQARLGGARWGCRHISHSFLMKSGDDSLFVWVFASDSITAVLHALAESRKWGEKRH